LAATLGKMPFYRTL